jgi:hypothetical protein
MGYDKTCKLVGTCTKGTTGKDVEPTVRFPSAFETVAVIVAVPTDTPLTITLVLFVNVPVGLTMAAGLVMEREMGVVFDEGETVAVVVAVCPTETEEMVEKDTVGATVPLAVFVK